MLYVNDDMDELFRRAADNYPLKTDSAEWKKVSDHLPVNNLTTPDPTPDTKNRYWLLLLLLLIPIIWLSNNYLSTKKPVNTAQKLKNSSPITNAVTSADNALSATIEIGTISTSLKQHPSTVASTHHVLSIPSHTKSTITNPDVVVAETAPPAAISNDPKILIQTEEQSPATGKKDIDTKTVNPNITTENKQAPVKNVASEAAEKKSTKSSKNKQSHLYAGIMAGVDVSTVKLQNILNAGLQGGVLIGYNFNKRLSLESGLYFDKKYYYTDGKYFDSKTLYLQGSAKVVDVKGNCYMLEVPLNLKYNFVVDGKSQWFSILGFSSYFMKKQSYDYNIQYNNYQYQKYADYTTPSNTFFSVINLGVGYTNDLGKKIKLRIEPYVKVPIQKIGVGNLPITSAGINVGITKKF